MRDLINTLFLIKLVGKHSGMEPSGRPHPLVTTEVAEGARPDLQEDCSSLLNSDPLNEPILPDSSMHGFPLWENDVSAFF
jgi:hypothetical protein